MNNLIRVAFLFILLLKSHLVLAETTSQLCDRNQLELSQKKLHENSVIQSAEKIFQHFYQNSEAYNLPPYEFFKHGELKGFGMVENPISKGKNSFIKDLSLAQSSQYYIDCKAYPTLPICLTPPSYIWGGMGWYEKNQKEELLFNLHGNNALTTSLAQHPGLDCSGFTYAVFNNAKLRVTNDLTLTPSFETADNTPARSYMNLDEKSCFNEIMYSPKMNDQLKSGDVIVWKTHIILIDTVGSDPFGISHIKRRKDCTIDKIKPDASTMIILNSKGGISKLSSKVVTTYKINSYFNKSHRLLTKNPNLTTGVGIGISKQYLKEFFYTSPKIFFDLALNACKAQFQKVKSLDDVKLIRHKAFYHDQTAPCACFSREQDVIELRP